MLVKGGVTGKRVLMLAAGMLMFVGSMWNMHVMDLFAEFMVARCFQGVGWGVFDALIGEGVGDLFFVSFILSVSQALPNFIWEKVDGLVLMCNRHINDG